MFLLTRGDSVSSFLTNNEESSNLMSNNLTPYLSFDRNQWAELRNSVPMTLTQSDLEKLKGINEHLSMSEATEIYLPLTRLLNLHVESKQRKNHVLEQFLARKKESTPYIIGIAGSVAVGKSTTARLLKELLSNWGKHTKVELVTTDGFLHPNKLLNERNIMKKKGFPESYDMKKLVQFVSDVKSGKPRVDAPIYSHLTYDITTETKVVEQPDILIIEGLNVLQSGMDYPHDPHRVFISDFLDFSIFVDAEPELIERWYIERFMKFRQGAFQRSGAYFNHYTRLSENEATETARSIWQEINGKNLEQNILPTKERASMILQKGANHAVETILLRK